MLPVPTAKQMLDAAIAARAAQEGLI